MPTKRLIARRTLGFRCTGKTMPTPAARRCATARRKPARACRRGFRGDDQSPGSNVSPKCAGRTASNRGAARLCQQGRDPQQSVDPGIAGYQDPLAADPSQQIGAGTRRSQVGSAMRVTSLRFTSSGRANKYCPCASRLRHAQPGSGDRMRKSESRGGVALHNDPIGPNRSGTLTPDNAAPVM